MSHAYSLCANGANSNGVMCSSREDEKGATVREIVGITRFFPKGCKFFWGRETSNPLNLEALKLFRKHESNGGLAAICATCDKNPSCKVKKAAK